MAFFRIIMPNYNNEQWLDKSIGSVLSQTFTNYTFILVDDMSTDNSVDKALKMLEGHKQCSMLKAKGKLWNGGARNEGIRFPLKSKYTLFLDSDDWFGNPYVLQKLHDFIVDHNEPDCVRLPFVIEHEGDKELPVMLNDNNADKLVHSIFVACWTKCIKSDLIVPFPENTLMEDVVQHIAQCDKIAYEVAVFNEPVVRYNRNNPGSCSIAPNQDLQHGKWQSSMYRYMADLLDLKLKHDYCKEHRDWRASVCLENIKKGVYSQSV